MGLDSKTYDFDAIREILTRDPHDITPEEYAALLILIDMMNTVDANGRTVPDLEYDGENPATASERQKPRPN